MSQPEIMEDEQASWNQKSDAFIASLFGVLAG